MKKVTVSFYVRDNRVVRAEKLSGPGTGCDNGYGGKQDPEDANIFHTVVREDAEEGMVHTRIEDIEPVAHIVFKFGGKPTFEAYVFIVHKWEGEHAETKEMGPPIWHPIHNLPLERMWKGDRLWLPQLLAEGKYLDGYVDYAQDGEEVANYAFAEILPATLREMALNAKPESAAQS